MGVEDRRGVSPVIATIIIVAIAIVMSLAVAYWMLGLGGAFTRYEKLEFQSAYVTVDNNFTINIRLKNTGSADATIDLIFLNGKPSDAEDYIGTVNTGSLINKTIKPGESYSDTITLTKGDTWRSGMTVEIMIQTVAGRQFPKSVILP